MGILKKITDEYFGKVKREEDDIKSNIKYLSPVDIGGSVLWANRDFVVKSDWYSKHGDYLKYSEVFGIKFEKGWRLPTVDEFLELFFVEDVIKVSEEISYNKSKRVYFEFGGDKLIFKNSGFRLDGYDELLFKGTSFLRWTSEKNDKNKTYLFDCSYDHDTAEEVRDNRDLLCSAEEKGGYFPVRLVKDKK